MQTDACEWMKDKDAVNVNLIINTSYLTTFGKEHQGNMKKITFKFKVKEQFFREELLLIASLLIRNAFNYSDVPTPLNHINVH